MITGARNRLEGVQARTEVSISTRILRQVHTEFAEEALHILGR